ALGLSVSPGLASAQTSDAGGAVDAPATGPAPGDAGPVDAAPVDAAPVDAPVDTPPADAAPADAAVHDRTDTDPRALDEFRPILDKYGVWVEDSRYGLVWVPDRRWVGDDFAPYLTRGHWSLDTAGDWVWMSDYPFGRVVFHYGRWTWVVGLGWAWVPGYRYAPAWVSWRVPTHAGAYVGWAPMPPSHVWVGGVAVGVGFYVMTPWVFCPSYYIFSPHLHHHHVHEPSRMKEAARQTKPYHPQVGARGPSPAAVGVPASRVPASRVRAQATPTTAADALRRHSGVAEPAAADSRRGVGAPELVGGGRARTATPPLPAQGRTGVSAQPRALPAPLPRAPSSATNTRVLRPHSSALWGSRESPWRPSASSTAGARYGSGAPQPGRALLPRATTVPQRVAPAPPPAPVRAEPSRSRR
ncbi:MAG TPA: DUF6600 domain-containing protein, partial [Polyangiaceae bacterium]|nr:DUF6600 domain-containing protein [Polyangiaceae bacterium]